MSLALPMRLRSAFAPPRSIAPPLAGIDISSGSIKAVELAESPTGLVLRGHAQVLLPAGAFVDGDIIDEIAVVQALSRASREAKVVNVNAALPESKASLFETEVAGSSKREWRNAVEERLRELVPYPPEGLDFDFVPAGIGKTGNTLVAGSSFRRGTIDSTLRTLESAGFHVHALEGESFATARALLPSGDQSTTLIVDVGKTTTKLYIVVHRIPRFATVITVGAHALTLAAQKYFGVTEAEARKIKAEKGIVVAGNEEYVAVMLSTISVIKDEIVRRVGYWQSRASLVRSFEPVSQVILTGGGASVRGLPEYLEGALRIPVSIGDVFTNFASRDTWVPPIEQQDSLAYATAIGLALRGYTQ